MDRFAMADSAPQASPTAQQIIARVRAVREKDPTARFIGVRGRPEWTGPPFVRVGDDDVPVVSCPSPLALREALVAHAGTSGRVVLLVDRDESELGLDVLARLARRRLFDLDPWALVLELFRAREWDHQLKGQRWLAEALLEGAGADGYPALATGVLDADTVWRHVFTRHLGFSEAARDLQALLLWARSATPDAVRLLASDEARKEAARRLTASAGPAAVPVLNCAIRGDGADAIPIGLVLRTLASRDGETSSPLREWWVRLEERLLGGEALKGAEASDWAAAAESVVERSLGEPDGRKGVAPWLDRAEALLQRVDARAHAWRSAYLPSGLALRLERWGEQLDAALGAGPGTPSADLAAAAGALLEHRLARKGETRVLPVDMALRLVRWLAEREARPTSVESLPDAARAYHADGGLVDRARAAIWDEGAAPAVRRAYATLVERVDAHRRTDANRFGILLASWVSSAGDTTDTLPIEQVLDRVVAPLARTSRVLLVVLDGMSVAVLRELEDDLLGRAWAGIEPAEGPLPPVIAAFPTVTAVSRTSLLTGKLQRGCDADEAPGFAAHAGLRSASAARRAPVLFHKGTLLGRGASGLSDEILKAIDDSAQQVVGVVVNAVDDHLLKGDQVRVAWSVETIGPLDALLARAKDAGRVVILTSDHGHVVERGTEYRSFEGADERWRMDDGQEGTDEVLLRGPRVLGSGTPGMAIRVPWSERIRYSTGKRHGYHGGASPAEVVVPLGVFAPGEPPPGWRDAVLARPSWWTGVERAALVPPPKTPAGPLFSATSAPPRETDGSRKPAVGRSWVDGLLAAPTFKAQLERTARGAPDPELVRRVLDALVERGGKLTTDALAVRARIMPFRIPTTLAALRRLLNVDGYPVLTLDEASQTVILDRALLETQFELET